MLTNTDGQFVCALSATGCTGRLRYTLTIRKVSRRQGLTADVVAAQRVLGARVAGGAARPAAVEVARAAADGQLLAGVGVQARVRRRTAQVAAGRLPRWTCNKQPAHRSGGCSQQVTDARTGLQHGRAELPALSVRIKLTQTICTRGLQNCKSACRQGYDNADLCMQ